MSPILNIIKTTRKFWKYYVVTGFFVVFISALNLVNPLVNKRIVDLIVDNVQNHKSDYRLLIIFLSIIVATDIFITFFTNIAGYLGDRLGSLLNTDLTSRFYRHLLHLEIEYFDNEITGSIMNRLQRGIQNITDFINQMLNNFLPFLLTAVMTIILISFYSWEIGLLLALLFPLYIIISDKSSKRWIQKQEGINKFQDKNYGRVSETISSIRIVKSFINENLEYKSFRNNRKEVEQIVKKQSAEWHRFDIYRRLILNIILSAIYIYVIYYTYNGRFTISQMILLIQLVTQARFPLFAMSFILGQIQQASAGSEDFFKLLKQPIKIKDKKEAASLDDVKGEVKYKNISFKYDGDKKVLSNISFTLKPGEKLAIVGESGGGKSTVTNLLMRFYEPQEGEILIDGININEITQKSLHKNIGVVLQESLLFSGTIWDNIIYGKPSATKEEVIEAAKAANAHNFIMNFPNGYNTEIGEKGVKLSGGQKQRISIARAVLKDAPILVLDEATSSLDSKAEKEVQTALDRLMEGRTTIIIAHRLSTIKDVDHIIVLKNGEIVEEGAPDILAEENGIYTELLKLQSTLGQTKHIKHKKLQEFGLQA